MQKQIDNRPLIINKVRQTTEYNTQSHRVFKPHRPQRNSNQVQDKNYVKFTDRMLQDLQRQAKVTSSYAIHREERPALIGSKQPQPMFNSKVITYKDQFKLNKAISVDPSLMSGSLAMKSVSPPSNEHTQSNMGGSYAREMYLPAALPRSLTGKDSLLLNDLHYQTHF